MHTHMRPELYHMSALLTSSGEQRRRVHHALQEVLCSARQRAGEAGDPAPGAALPHRRLAPAQPTDQGRLGRVQTTPPGGHCRAPADR